MAYFQDAIPPPFTFAKVTLYVVLLITVGEPRVRHLNASSASVEVGERREPRYSRRESTTRRLTRPHAAKTKNMNETRNKAWRLRCPKGHASLKHRHQKGGYWCQACRRTYRGDPYDAKHTTFPVIDP